MNNSFDIQTELRLAQQHIERIQQQVFTQSSPRKPRTHKMSGEQFRNHIIKWKQRRLTKQTLAT